MLSALCTMLFVLSFGFVFEQKVLKPSHHWLIYCDEKPLCPPCWD